MAKSKNKMESDVIARLYSKQKHIEEQLYKQYLVLFGYGKVIDLLIKKGLITNEEASNCFKDDNTESPKGVSGGPENNEAIHEADCGHSQNEQGLCVDEDCRDSAIEDCCEEKGLQGSDQPPSDSTSFRG